MAKMNWDRVRQENNARRWGYAPRGKRKIKTTWHGKLIVKYPGSNEPHTFNGLRQLARTLQVPRKTIVQSMPKKGRITHGPLEGFEIRRAYRTYRY